MAWVLRGKELPFDSGRREWWIDDAGKVSALPVGGADELPGRHVLMGLVDAHAHASVGPGAAGPVAVGAVGAIATLDAWRAMGVAIVRDLGAPHSVTLSLSIPPGFPRLEAAGRFLAPAGQYFPHLHEPVAESNLVEAARTEIERGAGWVKIIADFPRQIEPGAISEPTYTIESVARVVEAAHAAGARVAAHSTIDNVLDLVHAGVDSIEHGVGMNEDALRLMAERGTAWTPTLSARFNAERYAQATPELRLRIDASQERTRQLLSLAVRQSVPILTGTDVVGTLPGEVAHLTGFGLNPADAIAAATSWAYSFLSLVPNQPGILATFVTYQEDPLSDPQVLQSPAAVVIGGVRVR